MWGFVGMNPYPHAFKTQKNTMTRIIETNGTVTEVTPANGQAFSLKELQTMVGGYIEVLRTPKGIFVFNECGLIDGLQPNPKATKELQEQYEHPIQTLVGNVVVCEPKYFK